MGWNALITNIITQTELNAAVAPLATSASVTSGLAGKVSSTSGTADNLTLTNMGAAAGSAATKSYVDGKETSLTSSINLKANKAGDTFTGAITVPNGTLSGHAVNLGQLQTYLPLAGGTVTGPISIVAAPTVNAHLANKQYVDNKVIDYATIAELDTKADIDSPALVGVPTSQQPASDDNSNQIATTGWVRTLVSNDITVFSQGSPALGGVPTAPTALPATNTTQIATTAFVKAAIDALRAELI